MLARFRAFVVALALIGVPSAGCEQRAPMTPPRPPPSRGLLPSERPPPPPAPRDPLALPTKGGRPVPRERIERDPSIGGGALVNVVRTSHTATYPGAPGRDLAAELRSRVGGLGLESCLARAATRTQTAWELDYNNPGLQRAEVERVAPPPEPARTVRLRSTFAPSGRVSSTSLDISPPVDANAEACMRARADTIRLDPMLASSTAEVTFGLAPR
ncbi:MAG: hypothetical protein IT379_41650 [Deltaproteobacteria bacterium]|nr:hypothetical protein [Deltaproteobacteria bacterium]